MYRRKAFVHWYTGEGMDELEFVSCPCILTFAHSPDDGSLRPSPTCKTWFPSTCSTRRPATRTCTTRRPRPLSRRRRRLKPLFFTPAHHPHARCCRTPLFSLCRKRTHQRLDEPFTLSRRPQSIWPFVACPSSWYSLLLPPDFFLSPHPESNSDVS